MINKFQQGGKQDAVMQFVQGLAQTLQADPQQVIQIAQQNPQALEAAIQTYQQTKDIKQAAQTFQQAVQQQTQAARHGAKLNYIKSLKNQCAEDEEIVYYKKGGSVGCGCKKKENGGEIKKAEQGAVAEFKMQYGNKMMQLAEANKNRKEAEEERKKREDKWRKGQIVVGKDIQKGQENSGPKAKTQTDQALKDNKGIGKNKCGSKIKKHQEGSVIAQFKKAYKQGGSLNGIPFYQGGTNEGGIQSMAELIPIYGTYKAGQRFFRNPSWRTAGELAISGLADAAMVTGIGTGVGAALKAGNMAVKAGKVAKVASNLKKIKAARNLKYGQPYGISGYSDDAARTASNLASDALTYGTDYGKAVQQGNKLIRQANWADGAADTYNTAKWMGESALGSGITGALARKK